MTSTRVSSSLVALFALLVVTVTARKLPSAIKPCSRNDPDLNKCALRNGRAALEEIWKGVPSYQLPVLDPLRINEIDIAEPPAGSPRQVSLALKMLNVDVVGLRNTQLEHIKVDLKGERLSWKLAIPRVSLLGKYTVNGKVLVLPIVGNGDMNITLDNMNAVYSFDMGLAPRKNGVIYMNPKNSALDFETTRTYINLDNLFNGEPTLSKSMNDFLNENWREMVSELGPPVAEALNQVLTSVMIGIARTVPYSEIFPDTPTRR